MIFFSLRGKSCVKKDDDDDGIAVRSNIRAYGFSFPSILFHFPFFFFILIIPLSYCEPRE